MTPSEVLDHNVALSESRSPRVQRIANLEAWVYRLAERHKHTDSMDAIEKTVKKIKEECDLLPHRNGIRRDLLMEDIFETLEQHNIPTRRIKNSVDN